MNFFPSVNLITTNACRMRCKFCCAEGNDYKKIKSNKKNLLKIIKILSDNGTKRICFSGGEPLLNPNINELISYSYNLNIINTIMSSDGKLINKLSINPEFIDTFWISVHGLKDEHDAITQVKDSFNNIDFAIKNQILNYPFGIWSVVTPQNKDNIDLLIKWCIENNIKKLYLSNINEVGKGHDFINNYNRITDNNFEKLLNKYQKKYNTKINISGQRFSKLAQCVLVYPNGNVYITPFNNDEGQKMIGNLFKDNPKDIFLKIKNDKTLWNDYIYRYNHSSILKEN